MLAARFIDFEDNPKALQFVLKPARRRGAPKKIPDWEIATIVERHLQDGRQMKAACSLAADKFGVSERQAEKAHSKEKDQIRSFLKSGVKIHTRFDR
jgi:hypothetical protein